MKKELGFSTGNAAMRVRRSSAYLTLNSNPTMYATEQNQHRAAPGRLAQRFALTSKSLIPPTEMDASVRQFLNDLTRREPRVSRPFGTFRDAALEAVKRNRAVLPDALAVVDAFAGELIAAAGITDNACFNDVETAIDETGTNHVADDRFIAGVIHPSREAMEAEVEALEAQIIASKRRILCLTRKLATLDRKPIHA